MSLYNLDEIWYVSHLATLQLISCSCSAPNLLLPSSSFCPAPAVLLPCSFQAPIRHISRSPPVPALFLPGSALLCSALLLPYSSPAPASGQPLPYSCPASFKLLSCTFLAPPQLLPSSCPLSALLYSTQLSSCPVPALLLSCSCFCPASLHHHLTTFFGTARAAFYRRFYC